MIAFGSLRPLVLAVILLGSALVGGPSAVAATSTPIGPGIQMFTDGAQCTANFVYRDAAGRVFVGYAAHCAGLGGATDTNGCTTKSLPLGTRVRFGTAANLLSDGTTVGYGRLRYSSWLTMQRLGEKSASACAYNDLALVQVDAAYRGRVNPTMPHWGGPVAIAGLPAVGASVYSIGSSSLRPGGYSPKNGSVTQRSTRQATVRTLNPGIPGDSGSGFLDSRGRAVGVLSTVALFPDTLSNGIGSLAYEVSYARLHWRSSLRLVPGRVAFHS